jgi:small subunit ribosomal protein S3e
MNKKKKFVNIGMMNAELSELLRRELGVDGFSSVDIRISPQKTDIVIRAAKPLNVLGVQGRRIRELQSVRKSTLRDCPQQSKLKDSNTL